ncbi:MAG: hypothetical protein H0U76_26120 [Ktedonobacteraceae bacterium]|nr:hypothetical protein [Ktedonobacteraceae bacterium]
MSSQISDPFSLARLMVKADTSINALATVLDGHNPPVLPFLYARARTPIWQLARRSSALVTRHFHKGALAQ